MNTATRTILGIIGWGLGCATACYSGTHPSPYGKAIVYVAGLTISFMAPYLAVDKG